MYYVTLYATLSVFKVINFVSIWNITHNTNRTMNSYSAVVWITESFGQFFCRRMKWVGSVSKVEKKYTFEFTLALKSIGTPMLTV